MQEQKNRNAGLTLIEILVGITILGIMLASLLSVFIRSGKANDSSAEQQKGSELALGTMEVVKTMTAEEVVTAFLDAEADPHSGTFGNLLPYTISGVQSPMWDASNGGTLQYRNNAVTSGDIDYLCGTLQGVKYGKYRYDIKVEMDGSYYQDDESITGSESGINDYSAPLLINMDSGSVGLIDYAGKIGANDSSALLEMIDDIYNQQVEDYLKDHEDGKETDPGWPVKLSESTIYQNTGKTISVSSQVRAETEDRYSLQINVEYYYDYQGIRLELSRNYVAELYYSGSQLNNIYMLFREDYSWQEVKLNINLDSIVGNNNGKTYNFYIIGQEPLQDGGSIKREDLRLDQMTVSEETAQIYNFYSDVAVIKAYTEMDGGMSSHDILVENSVVAREAARNRIYFIKITVRKAGGAEVVCELDSSNYAD